MSSSVSELQEPTSYEVPGFFSSVFSVLPTAQSHELAATPFNEQLDTQLKVSERYLFQVLDIRYIADDKDGAKRILSGDFRRVVLNIQPLYSISATEKSNMGYFNKNLKEAIQAFGTLLTSVANDPRQIDPGSLTRCVNNIILILQKLLLSVEIFDVEIQNSLKPLEDFLYKFNHLDIFAGACSVLKGFEFVKRFTARHEAKFYTEWESREDYIVSEANAGCSIEVPIRIILREYAKVNLREYAKENFGVRDDQMDDGDDNFWMNVVNGPGIENVYLRAKVILALSNLQSLRTEKGVPVLSELSKINEGIIILIEGHQAFEEYRALEGHKALVQKKAFYYAAVANEKNKLYDEVEKDVKNKIKESNEKAKKKAEDSKVENGGERENTASEFHEISGKFVGKEGGSGARKEPEPACEAHAGNVGGHSVEEKHKQTADPKSGIVNRRLASRSEAANGIHWSYIELGTPTNKESEPKSQGSASFILATLFGWLDKAKEQAKEHPVATTIITLGSFLLIGAGICVATGGAGLPAVVTVASLIYLKVSLAGVITAGGMAVAQTACRACFFEKHKSDSAGTGIKAHSSGLQIQ